MVLEADNAAGPEIEALMEAGIPLVVDRTDGQMHDKFVLIDRRQVWTGSMNFTLSDAYRNDNQLIAFSSPAAAAVYQAEFEEMFEAGLFGANSPAGTPSQVEIEGPEGEGIELEIAFSPDDGAAKRLVELIEAARESIHFMAFSFTSDEIGEAMLARAAQGVDVRGVFDESQLESSRRSLYEILIAAGLDVRVDGNPNILHHKAIIIDGRIVIAGSYNFSAGAETANDENMLVIHSQAVAALFLAEWERVFDLGK
jgi:phosphatidylserine/phosphatidylglycerophosphate/cardiolipin synthase-like enzyme